MAGRVAKAPISVPDGVEFKLIDQVTVQAKGKMGEMSLAIHPKVSVNYADSTITLSHAEGDRDGHVLSGTMRALVANMVHGVSQGFTAELEMRGAGYRAAMKGKALVLSVGYSHPVEMEVPAGLAVEIPAATQILVKGADKQSVMQFAANIRRKRPPEPYKGKGIRYKDEHITMKEGKKK